MMTKRRRGAEAGGLGNALDGAIRGFKQLTGPGKALDEQPFPRRQACGRLETAQKRPLAHPCFRRQR